MSNYLARHEPQDLGPAVKLRKSSRPSCVKSTKAFKQVCVPTLFLARPVGQESNFQDVWKANKLRCNPDDYGEAH